MSENNGIPISKQESYWDMWQDARSINPWAQRRSRILLDLLKGLKLEQPRILDFGCGNGWFCNELAEHGKVTGIDLSRSNMEKAQKQCPHIEFIGADLFEYPLPEASFDVVVSQQVLAHVSDQTRYIEKCAKLLTDGGHLILSTNNKLVMDRLGDKYVDDKALGHIEKWVSLKDLKELLDPSFILQQHQSIVPRGQEGFLRLVNSPKLNGLIGLVAKPASIEKFKERLGLGYINIVLARKR